MGDAMRVEDQQYDAYSFLFFYLLNFMYIYMIIYYLFMIINIYTTILTY